MMKKYYLFFFILMLFIFLPIQFLPAELRADISLGMDAIEYNEVYEKARVLRVEETSRQEYSSWEGTLIQQAVTVKVLSGPYKDHELTATNSLSGTAGMDIEVAPNDLIVICVQEAQFTDGTTEIVNIFVAEQWRSTAMYWLIIIFVALLIIIGRFQGFKSLLALAITVLGIYFVLLPGLIDGKSPVLLTIAILVVAALLSYIFGDLAQLHGLASEDDRMLLYVEGLEINMKGLLFSGIMIGAVGAIMDVAMSIASAISEIKAADPSKNALNLFKAGMNVGKDIMGTMTNTLILAYTGSALPMLILFLAYDMEAIRILNWELIVTEVVRALVGSIALILCVPVTAVVAGWLMGKTVSAEEALQEDGESPTG